MASKFRLTGLTLATAGISLLAVMLPGEAAAQFFPRPYLYGGYYSGPIAVPVPRRPVGMATEDIIDDLEARGYRAITIANRRRDVIVVNAIDPRRQPVRLVVDVYDGEILERFAREGEPRIARETDALRGPAAPNAGLNPLGTNPDARKRDNGRVAEIPAPPRRPGGEAAPSQRPAPVAPARPSSEWLPADLAPKPQ